MLLKVMRTQTQELIKTLKEIEEILRSEEEAHWADWMLTSRQALEESDFWGIEKLLKAYGGMGSFNDLVLSQPSKIGAVESAQELGKKDDRLSVLRTRAYELATDIRRNPIVKEA
jgi:hypothetical protein